MGTGGSVDDDEIRDVKIDSQGRIVLGGFTDADAKKIGVDIDPLGGEAPSHFPYATVTINGEPWLFEFPWGTYQHLQTYLSIPAREDR